MEAADVGEILGGAEGTVKTLGGEEGFAVGLVAGFTIGGVVPDSLDNNRLNNSKHKSESEFINCFVQVRIGNQNEG